MQPGSWGKAAAGLEDLIVCNFSALLHAGQSGNLGPTAFFLSIHVASPGPRYPEHDGLHPAFLSEGSGMSATPGASDLILVELSWCGSLLCLTPVWPAKASLSWRLIPFDQSVNV